MFFYVSYDYVFHCVKNVRRRRYSGPYFPAFGLNNRDIRSILPYSVRMRENVDQLTPNTDTFDAMLSTKQFRNQLTCFLARFMVCMIKFATPSSKTDMPLARWPIGTFIGTLAQKVRKKQKPSLPKEQVKNADLQKPMLNKIITQE